MPLSRSTCSNAFCAIILLFLAEGSSGWSVGFVITFCSRTG
jgi:hypothetical protein